MNIIAITAIVLHLSPFSVDVYAGNKLAAHCTVSNVVRGLDTVAAWVKCEAPPV